MENISRIEVYQHLTHNSFDIGLSEKVRSLLDINLALLEGLEGIFLKEHKDSPEELVNRVYKDDFSSYYRVHDILMSNISNLKELGKR